jgi:uncharacterized membrane-anchored protein YhcB (DUF1043 family)
MNWRVILLIAVIVYVLINAFLIIRFTIRSRKSRKLMKKIEEIGKDLDL